MLDGNSLVLAGGIVALSAKTDADVASPFLAKSFTHPALVNRVIVRLADESLAAAVDAEMGVLGFESHGEAVSVGRAKKRALGFPSWALVHHPKDARFALDVMRDFRRAANRIKTKPGHARDAFAEIGKELERKVPAFLPSFWEEAGRAFLDQESPAMAGSCFEKARAAERAYKLVVDEDRRGDAYLEFTLAGAVPAKSLAGYASELVTAFGALEAERRYRTLNVHRIRGGVAPFTGLAKELRKLAKEAKRPEAEADGEFLVAVLDAPSLAKAPADFWTAYGTSLRVLAKKDPVTSKRIRDLFPKPKGFEKFFAGWLDLLADIGVVATLNAGPAEEAAAWLSALTQFVTFHDSWRRDPKPLPAAYFTFLEALAPRLVAEKTPVELAIYERWSGEDAEYQTDIIERALELGLSTKPKTENSSFELSTAIEKDPLLIEASEAWNSLLKSAVSGVFGNADFEAKAAGKKGFVEARRACLHSLIDSLSGGIPAMEAALRTLESKTTPAIYAEFPKAKEALAAVKITPAAQKTLQSGLFDEFTWPAWEKALAEATVKPQEIAVEGTARHPILRFGQHVVVFDGATVLRSYDLPAIVDRVDRTMYVCAEPTKPMSGDLLVSFREKSSYDRKYLWMKAPKEVHEAEFYFRDIPEDVPLPGGVVTYGGPPIRPGDAVEKLDTSGDLIFDGSQLFRAQHSYNEPFKLVEIDLQTFAKGRASWPKHLQTISEASDGFRLAAVTYVPAPAGAEKSPLGFKDGFVGFYRRIQSRQDAADMREHVRVDGVTYTSTSLPDALLSMPGDGSTRRLDVSSGWSDTRDDTYSFEGEDGETLGAFGASGLRLAGFARTPRVDWLHFLVTRDEKTSAALRSLDEATVEALLAGARGDAAPPKAKENSEEDEDDYDDDEDEKDPTDDAFPAWPATTAALTTAFPGVDTVLQKAIAQVLARAVTLEQRLGALTEASTSTAPAKSGRTDNTLLQNIPFDFDEGYQNGPIDLAFPLIISGLLGDGNVVPIPDSRVTWERHAATFVRALAFLMTRPHHDAESRTAYRAFLGAIAEQASAFFGATLHVATLKVLVGKGVLAQRPKGRDTFLAKLADGRAAFVRVTSEDEDEPQTPYEITLVVADREGIQGFTVPVDATGDFTTVTVPDDHRFLTEVLTAYDAHGPVPYVPATDAAKIAAAVDGTPLLPVDATLIFAGLPNLRTWTHDFLGADLRTALDLKLREAAQAKDRLRGTTREPFFPRFLADATLVPAAGDLWGDGGYTAFQATVASHLGSQIAVPEELIVLCDKQLALEGDTRKVLAALRSPDAEMFRGDGLISGERFGLPRSEMLFLDESPFVDLAQLLPFLAATLPVGDPFRTALPEIYDRLRAELLEKNRFFALPSTYEYDAKKRAALFARYGGTERKLKKNDAALEWTAKDDGVVFAVEDGNEIEIFVRTSEIMAERPRVLTLLNGTGDDDDRYGGDGVRAALYLLSEDCAAVVARLRETPVAAGSLETNPAISVPKLVAKVAKDQGISSEGAALYLQTLALPQPTTKAVCAINGWKPAAYTKACAELAEKGLFVEGKREKTGRGHFLPGGWDAKFGPMETWKAPLYDPKFFGEPMALLPYHLLFERAYARIENGDTPRFEEAVRAKKTAKKSSK
jgi:hypothetical protein